MIIIKHQKAVQATSHLPGWMMGTISVGIWVQGHHGALCQGLRLKMYPRMCYHKVSWILFFTLAAVHYISVQGIIGYPAEVAFLLLYESTENKKGSRGDNCNETNLSCYSCECSVTYQSFY